MRKRTSLAQTLALDPDIILMDEPFSALDIQTRQLMENEVLALWAAKKKAVLFITHDLDEAIAMSDRVVVLVRRAGLAADRRVRSTSNAPRDVAEVAPRRASSSCTSHLGGAARRGAQGLPAATAEGGLIKRPWQPAAVAARPCWCSSSPGT